MNGHQTSDCVYDSAVSLKNFSESTIKIALVNLHNQFMFTNHAFRTAVYLTAADTANHSFIDCLDFPSQTQFLMAQRQLLDGDRLLSGDLMINFQGNPEPHYLTLGIVRGPKGAPQYFRVLIRDLAQQQDYTSTCRSKMSHTEIAPVIICAVDRDGLFCRFEGGAANNIIGTLQGRHYTEVYAEFEETKDHVFRAMSGETFDVEVYSEGFWYHVWYEPVTSEDGQLGGATWTSYPIDKQKHLEARLHEEIKLREDLLSMASHEIRSPLSALSLQLQLMERYLCEASEPTKDLVSMGRRQVKTIATLVEKTLDFSRIGAHGIAVEPARCDLRDIINQVVHKCSGRAQAAECPVNVHAPKFLDGDWDSFRMEQVIENLLTNAIKYGAGQPISISLRESTAQVNIEIQDGGNGIDPVDQKRIFERFERANTDKNIAGFGLGLYIVKKIVNAHHGSITVHSILGKGSTFIISLPRYWAATP